MTERRRDQAWTKRTLVGIALLGGALAVADRMHPARTSVPDRNPSIFAAAADSVPTVDVAVIAVDLDRANSRDDITCALASAGRPATVECHATDGATWTARVDAPPAGFTVTSTTPSVYVQSARLDAWSAAQGILQCQRLRGGELPPSVTGAIMQADMQCAGGVMTLHLNPGDHLDYDRVSATRFTVQVTAANGEIATYDSASRKITP